MRSVSVNLWKSDKPVSKVYNVQNDLEDFLKIKSIHIGTGLSGFLKHVWSFVKYADDTFHKRSS